MALWCHGVMALLFGVRKILTIAYSSLRELLNQTIVSLDLSYISKDQYNEIRNQTEKVSNKLNALSKYFKSLSPNTKET
jgi:four helix bundle protein